MEGMISKEIIPIQENYIEMGDSLLSIGKWVQDIVVRLLKVTHDQWLPRNIHIHNDTCGVAATARKEEIQCFIED